MKQFPKLIPIKGRVRICLEWLKSQNLKNKTLVDIGCSFGWMEQELAHSGTKKIIGVELNPQAVEFAKKNVKNAEFLVGSALELPIKDGIADIATLYDVIEHVPPGTEKQALTEANRILKPGGILLLSTPFDHPVSKFLDLAWYFGHRHYSSIKITQLLQKTGFRINKVETRGSIFSSLFLVWFYLAKRLTGSSQPKFSALERLDDLGFNKKGITDIFVIAQKKS